MTVGMLLEAIERRIPHGAAAAAARRFGDGEEEAETALRGLISSILAGVCVGSRDDSFLLPLFESLRAPENRDFVGGTLGDAARADISRRFVNDLFGPKAPAVLKAVAAEAGVGRDTVEELSSLAAPVVTGALGDRITERDLGPAAFRRYLASEEAIILRAAPDGVPALIADADFAGEGTSAGAVRHGGEEDMDAGFNAGLRAPVAPARPPRAAGGRAAWIWAVPVLVVAGLIGWFAAQEPESAPSPRLAGLEGDQPAARQTDPPRAPSARNAAAAPALSGSLNAVTAVPEPDEPAPRLTVDALGGAPDGVEAKLLEFITSGRGPCVEPECWLTFDRLTFAPGSATLDMDRSGAQIENIARIMAAYPDLELKIAGYTDSTGGDDLNMRLSQERAAAVMAAIVALGVAPERLVAEGYGAQFPIADNATEEGRAKNRRISARVRRF